MTARVPLPAAIIETCSAYYGTAKRYYRDNRCDSCPLRAPCLKSGATKPNTLEQLDESTRTFVAESMAIIGATGGDA